VVSILAGGSALLVGGDGARTVVLGGGVSLTAGGTGTTSAISTMAGNGSVGLVFKGSARGRMGMCGGLKSAVMLMVGVGWMKGLWG